MPAQNKQSLAILPDRQANAFAQMAEDALLLDCYPEKDQLRFRHYTWEKPAFTFGYSQSYAWVESQMTEPLELCRRMTGGGLVDHRCDWTYALVIPPSHPWYAQAASQTYRQNHEALAQAFQSMGQAAIVRSCDEPDVPPPASGMPTFCFSRAEPCDVIHPESRQKIAGAALRRNRSGLLLQGSVEKSLVPDGLDWPAFGQAFIAALEARLEAPALSVDRPEYAADQALAVYEQFASSDWNQRR